MITAYAVSACVVMNCALAGQSGLRKTSQRNFILPRKKILYLLFVLLRDE